MESLEFSKKNGTDCDVAIELSSDLLMGESKNPVRDTSHEAWNTEVEICIRNENDQMHNLIKLSDVGFILATWFCPWRNSAREMKG